MSTEAASLSHWPLDGLLARLQPDALSAELEELRAESEALADWAISPGDAPWKTLLARYLALDERFEALSSIVHLAHRQRRQSERVLRAEQALAKQGLHLHRQTAPLVEAWRRKARKQKHRRDACPMQLEWLKALDRLDRAAVDDPQQTALMRLLAEGWHHVMSASPVGPDEQGLGRLAELLQTRVEADQRCSESGWPPSLHRWGALNDVDFQVLDTWTDSHAESGMPAYARALQRGAGLSRCDLKTFRDLERRSMAIPRLDDVQAVKLVLTALGDIDPQGARLVRKLVRDGRLAFRPASELALCIDTPCGAYVSLSYQPDLNGLMLLAHELGHAVQYEKRRAEGRGHIPLTTVASEAAALSAERALVLWLVARGEPWATPARQYLTAQTLEMDHRHRMLSQFELGLYQLPELTVASISAHWLELNRRFYGATIQFDPGFATAWSELHHLFTAPWYLLAYPLAMQRFRASS